MFYVYDSYSCNSGNLLCSRLRKALLYPTCHLARILLRTFYREKQGLRRMRHIIISLVALAGVLMVAANAARGF